MTSPAGSPMTSPVGLGNPVAFDLIRVAHQAALAKYNGPITTDLNRAALILCRESGEVAEATLDLTRATPTDTWSMSQEAGALLAELAQVSQVVLQMMGHVISASHPHAIDIARSKLAIRLPEYRR